MYSSTVLTSILDSGKWLASHHGRFSLRERAPRIHWREGWVKPGASLDDAKRKISCPFRELSPSSSEVQPVARPYTSKLC